MKIADVDAQQRDRIAAFEVYDRVIAHLTGDALHIFEVADRGCSRQVDGVVCGHIHRAEITRINNVDYFNCGDWVESCTALVEHPNGKMEILYWADIIEQPHAIAQAA